MPLEQCTFFCSEYKGSHEIQVHKAPMVNNILTIVNDRLDCQELALSA
jgi:hypothetical protein